jgi:hypothetical protein
LPIRISSANPAEERTRLGESGPALRFTPTGRSLVRPAPGTPGRGLVAFGAIDYNTPPGGALPTGQPAEPRGQTETLLALVEAARTRPARAQMRAGGLQAFAPLEQTAVELDSIATIKPRP